MPPSPPELLRAARVAMQQNDFLSAVDALESLVAHAERTGDIDAETRHRGSLALLYNRLGLSDDALTQLHQALELAQTIGNRTTESALRGNLGHILRETGDPQAAIDQLQQALAIAAEAGDQRGRGNWLSSLGLVYDDLDNTDTAADYHAQSVEIARQLHDQRGLAERLGNLSSTLMSSGQILQALHHLEEAVTLYRDLGDTVTLVIWLNVLGNVYAELGDVATGSTRTQSYLVQALSHYREARKLARTHADAITEAAILRSMGDAYAGLNSTADAIACYQESARLYEHEGMTDLIPPLQAAIEQAKDD